MYPSILWLSGYGRVWPVPGDRVLLAATDGIAAPPTPRNKWSTNATTVFIHYCNRHTSANWSAYHVANCTPDRTNSTSDHTHATSDQPTHNSTLHTSTYHGHHYLSSSSSSSSCYFYVSFTRFFDVTSFFFDNTSLSLSDDRYHGEWHRWRGGREQGRPGGGRR